MMINLFACLSDNYGFLLRDEKTGQVAAIDSPDAGVIEAEIERLQWGRLDYIYNTHWHADHIGGNAALKARFDCHILGPAEVAQHTHLDEIVRAGETINFGETEFKVLDLSGHTLGLIGYHSPEEGAVFVGDCLFTLGCGRLFEGTPAMMWVSLERLMALPDKTLIYCAHEYTLSNLAFAESLREDFGHNEALTDRAKTIRALRKISQPTVPTRLIDEKLTNPFLYYPALKKTPADKIECFSRLRAAKDRF
jgi:hydroxyacylglutathione hydrolase